MKSRIEYLDVWLNALPGVPLEDVPTPALIVDIDALTRNISVMANYAARMGVRLRAHAKTHKSLNIAKLQISSGACGICCQKVSEAEVFVDGGIGDILISNQVIDPLKLRKAAELASKARIIICVDDANNIDDASSAAAEAGTVLECLVEVDVGSARCGVQAGDRVVDLATRISNAANLRFSGIQAYHGAAQHILDFAARSSAISQACNEVRATVECLKEHGFTCEIIGGAGTGTYQFESESGLFNEIQCGSYVFMDADYQKIKDGDGRPINDFENSLFVWTQVISKVTPGKLICDAGLKAHSVDSGLPKVYGQTNMTVSKCSDEHAVIFDPDEVFSLGDKLKLVPGHCDPTCNLYDYYIGISKGKVAEIWPVTARGLLL